jgi:hypothetical protein
MNDLNKKLAENEKVISEAQLKTNLTLLKIRLFQMGLNLKTTNHEEYKNLESRIKEMGG